MSVEDRFWGKVNRSAGTDGCWPWLAGKAKGYGLFCIGNRVNVQAHRYSFCLANPGVIELRPGGHPQGVRHDIVRHSCDNPACVNPKHLTVGSYQDNSDDMVSRGRQRNGSSKHGADVANRG